MFRGQIVGGQERAQFLFEGLLVEDVQSQQLLLDAFDELLAFLSLSLLPKIMKEMIELNVIGQNSFTVGFQHQDPQITMDVTNTLAELFIAENLKNREKLASGTTQFLTNELEKVENILKEKEKEISLFRAENMGKMPEDMNVNLSFIEATRKRTSGISPVQLIADAANGHKRN